VWVVVALMQVQCLLAPVQVNVGVMVLLVAVLVVMLLTQVWPAISNSHHLLLLLLLLLVLLLLINHTRSMHMLLVVMVLLLLLLVLLISPGVAPLLPLLLLLVGVCGVVHRRPGQQLRIPVMLGRKHNAAAAINLQCTACC
jgi:hypothetical protein